MPSTSNSEGRKPSFGRAFLPFWIGLVWSVISIASTFHLRERALTRIAMQVTIEGKEPDRDVRVTVNEQPQGLRSAVPMGAAKIRIWAEDCESQMQERFVWYGVTDLGAVDLVRSRGGIEAVVLPAPDRFELTGDGLRRTNSTGSFPGLIVGRYILTCRFGDLEERVEALVTRNQTTPVKWAAKVGGLELSADPAEGEFDLVPEGGRSGFRGTFPATIRRLASGDYRLTAKRPGYERELKVQVRPNETNQLVVKFAYGSAQISTKPEGATVLWAGVERGKTPLTLTNLVPGNYRLELRLAGFDTAGGPALVEPDATAKVTHAFVNTRYRESMESARRQLDQGRFEGALLSLDAALEAQPGDPIASGLRPETKARLVRSRAKLLAGQGDYEGARSTLESALRDSPDDKETMDLRDALLLKQTQEDAARKAAHLESLLDDAKSAAFRKDFDRALLVINEAKKHSSDLTVVSRLESEFRTAQAKVASEQAEAKRRAETAASIQAFNAYWDRSLSRDEFAKGFPDYVWKTSKSGAAVSRALERIATADSSFKISDWLVESTDCFTAKMGDVIPLVGTGTYVRIGVVATGDGNTRIVVRVISGVSWKVWKGQNSTEDRLQKHADRLRAALVKELGADVKEER